MATDPILALRDIVAGYGPMTILNGTSFDVPKGSITTVIGPNGAGKSTLFNGIAGVYAPTAGRIFFNGENIGGQKPWDLCKKGLARTFQIVKPFASKTVLYNVTVGSFATCERQPKARSSRNTARSRCAMLHRSPG